MRIFPITSIDNKRRALRAVNAIMGDDGEEVVIRKLGYGDKQQIQTAGTRLMAMDGSGESTFVIDLAETHLKMMELGIVSWTFKRANGKTAPVRRSSLVKLNNEDGAYIVEQIEAFNTPRAPAEQERFRGRAGDGAATGDGAG